MTPRRLRQPERETMVMFEQMVDWLRPLAPGMRTVKTALAVALAWWLATLLGEPRPLFAALGALVGMEATIAGTLRRTGLQLAGMLVGVALAFAITHSLGASAPGVGLAVLLGLWLGRRAGSPDRIGIEVGITALLIVVLASGDLAFGAERVWETVLGGLVAAAINALVLPPDYLDRLADDVHALVAAMASGLREATRSFVERPEHEGAAEALERVRAARATVPELDARLQLASSALRFNPLLRDRLPTLDRYRAAVRLYGRGVNHVAALARSVRDHAERPHPWSHGGLHGPEHLAAAAEALSLALERYEAYARAGKSRLLQDVRRELTRAEASLAAFLESTDHERTTDTPVQRIVDISAVGTELEHLAADLSAAIEQGPVVEESAVAQPASRL